LTSAGVEVVGQITHTMDESELSLFESKVNENGHRYYHVKYDREIYLGAREGTLQFKVTRNGKELGSTTIEFAKD
jgi:hypothetical protein